MSVEKQLKEQLDNIIENAYYNDPLKNKYKQFTLKVHDKEIKSYSGLYDQRTKKIEIFDIRDSESLSQSTLLHELAHHIDFTQNGSTGHKKPFYEAFKKLIYSALDLGYIDLEAMKSRKRRNTDHNKVQKILENYTYNKPVIDININQIISVKNSYNYKESLKTLGFTWNKVNREWQKNINPDEKDTIKSSLVNLGINDEDIIFEDTSKINLKYGGKVFKTDYVLFVDKAFSIKEELKRDGYHWYSQDKLWYKEFDSEEEFNEEIKRISEVYGMSYVKDLS